jgi:hypothetical protein
MSNCLNFRPLSKESNDSLNKNRILFLNLDEASDRTSVSSEYITKIGKHCTNFRIDIVELNKLKCLFFPNKSQNIASKFIQGYDAFSIMISGNYHNDLEFIDFLNSQNLFLKRKPILFIIHDNYICKKNSLLFLKQALDRSMNVVLPPPVLKGTELDQHSLINGWEGLLEYLWENDGSPVVDELKSF